MCSQKKSKNYVSYISMCSPKKVLRLMYSKPLISWVLYQIPFENLILSERIEVHTLPESPFFKYIRRVTKIGRRADLRDSDTYKITLHNALLFRQFSNGGCPTYGGLQRPIQYPVRFDSAF